MGPRRVLPVRLWRCYGVQLAAPELTQTIYAQIGSLSSLSIRQLTTSAAASQDIQHAVMPLLQEELKSLSIPAGELNSLASSGLSDAALTAWTLATAAGHPAAEQAVAASQRLRYLLAKLDGAALRQQAASSSPTAELLWRVAVAAAQQQLRGMNDEELASCVEYQVAQAAARTQHGSSEHTAAFQLLEQSLPQLVDTSPRNTLLHPAFWHLAQAAAKSHPGLPEDLLLMGYNLDAAVAASSRQLQQVEQLLGLQAATLQQQLATQAKVSSHLLLPEDHQQLLQAVSGNAAARTSLAQLQLLEVLAACLGLSGVQVCLPPSSFEVVRRLTGHGPEPHPVPQQLSSALQAAAPALLSAVSQLPASSLAQPGVPGLLQLLDSKPELQALQKALVAWRAEAAAAGCLPVLSSLSQAEVAVLSAGQAEAVGRLVMQLEAQGRLLLRQAAAGQLDLAGCSADVAAALAWKLHTGGPQAAEDLVELVMVQAAALTSQHESDADAAEGALAAMAAGFELEEATSRRNTAAPASPYVMAGIPQLQLEEMAQLAAPADGAVTSASRRSRAAQRVDTAERLVRDLAQLLTAASSSSSIAGRDGLQAAVQRLEVVAHDLPGLLAGPLLELLAAFQSGVVTDAAGVRQRQQQLQSFLQVVAAELPQQLQSGAAEESGSSWGAGGQVDDGAAAEGLLELMGEADSADLLRHAADQSSRGREGEGQRGHLYGWLANIHHDQDMQRYLQIEFDPSLDVEVVHTPRGWRDPDLFVSGPDFLDAMRPLLNTYLAAQGEGPLQETEWQVYRDAALGEAEQVEAQAAAQRHAAGHSPFNNSRADEAFLRERLDAGIPKDSVLYAAAHKYLEASFHNRTWRFAQRKRMVDVLTRIAAHLAAHPPRSHRGSPFSALFQPDGPPIVPRISQQSAKDAAAEAYALPPGFGPSGAAAAAAAAAP